MTTLIVGLTGCGGPAPSVSPAATAGVGAVPAGVVVVNRSEQPIAPVLGFVTPPCGEQVYDTATAQAISERMLAWARGEVADPAPPVGRLDAWIAPPRGRWFILVTSTDDPQLFFEGVVSSDLLANLPTAKPRPDEWPPCKGQARLG